MLEFLKKISERVRKSYRKIWGISEIRSMNLTKKSSAWSFQNKKNSDNPYKKYDKSIVLNQNFKSSNPKVHPVVSNNRSKEKKG